MDQQDAFHQDSRTQMTHWVAKYPYQYHPTPDHHQKHQQPQPQQQQQAIQLDQQKQPQPTPQQHTQDGNGCWLHQSQLQPREERKTQSQQKPTIFQPEGQKQPVPVLGYCHCCIPDATKKQIHKTTSSNTRCSQGSKHSCSLHGTKSKGNSTSTY